MRRVSHGLVAAAVMAAGLSVAATSPAVAAPVVTALAIAPDVAVNDVVFDDVTGRAYVVVPSADPEFGNHLVAFNPVNGNVLDFVFVGSEPNVVRPSVDGSVVWVGLDGADALVQVDAATMTVTRTIPLSEGSSPLHVEDIAPLPGDPDDVVVSLRRKGVSPKHGGVILVSDGVIAPDRTGVHTGANLIETVDDSRVVGFTVDHTGFDYWLLDIDADGVTVNTSIDTAIQGFGTKITYADGVVYGSNGRAIDAATGGSIASFASGGSAEPVVHDGRVYFGGGTTIQAFSTSTFVPDGPAISVATESIVGTELTNAGWLAWTETGHFDGRKEFATPTVPADGPITTGGGRRDFASTPSMQVADAVYDADHDRVYAVAPSTSPAHPNRLVAFDPSTGAVTDSLFVGSEPWVMALSHDAATIWVGLAGASSLIEVDRATFTIRRTIALGSGFWGPNHARHLSPVPGDTDAVVATLAEGEHGTISALVLVDDGVVAPDQLTDPYGANVHVAVSSTELLGFDNQTSGFGLYRIAIGPDGLTTTSTESTSLRGYSVEFVLVDGQIYGSNGAVIDAATGVGLGTYGGGQVASAIPPIVEGDYVYVADRYPSEIHIFHRAYGNDQDGRLVFDAELRGAILTPDGFIAWSESGFETGEIFFAQGAIAGRVTDDQTGTQVADLCVDAFEAGDFDFTLVGTTTTDQYGDWELNLPVGDYWIYYYECEYFDYLSEFHGDALPFFASQAEVLTVTEHGRIYITAQLRRMFVDVPAGSFYFQPSIFLWYAGITNGCGVHLYCPDARVSREQMAAFMARFWRLFDTCPTNASPFADVGPDSFAYYDVGCIAWLGVTTGTGPDTYSPDDFVTREQMAAFIARLWRAFGLECPTGAMPFTDVPTSSFAYADVICIFELGITTGTSATTYSPGQFVNRAQMAAFLERLFDAVLGRSAELGALSLSATSEPELRRPG